MTRTLRLLPLLVILLLTLAVAPLAAQSDADDDGPAGTPAVCNPAKPVVLRGTVERRITVDGLQRSYRLHIPASYDGQTALPLVFSLHGFTGNVHNQARITGWDALAEEHSFIVVYPQGAGIPSRWNTEDGALGSLAITDDVAFINTLIDRLSADLCIDEARVYVNGFSNGGGMTEYLACELSERIAAVATVAGAYNDDFTACQPTRPVPLMAFHGQADPIVPYFGGDDAMALPRIPSWITSWADRNGCDGLPDSFRVGPTSERQDFTACDAPVSFVVIYDAGHVWPGETAQFNTDDEGAYLDASAMMWDFYSEQRLP